MKNIERNCYTYLIGWSELNVWYYGSKYGKDADPSNFWVNYFTSSSVVKKFIVCNGNPDIITIRKVFGTDSKKTVNWESRVLKKIGVPNNKNFLNGHCAGGGYSASIQSAKANKNMIVCVNTETNLIQRISRNSIQWNSGKFIGIRKNKILSESQKKAISDATKGKVKSEVSKILNGISNKNSIWIYNYKTKHLKRLTKGNTIVPEGFEKVCGPHLLMSVEEKAIRDEIIKKEKSAKNKVDNETKKENRSLAQKKFHIENPLSNLKENDYYLLEKIFIAYGKFPFVPEFNSLGIKLNYNRSFANVYMKVFNCSHYKIYGVLNNKKNSVLNALKITERFKKYLSVIEYIQTNISK